MSSPYALDLVGLALGSALVLGLAAYLIHVLIHPDRF